MSNIEENLAFILSSRYGEDVRQAIHDSIHDCYEDGKAGAVDLVARERIANLVANNNPTEGNSELLDIRVDADGKTYPSAGDAVREQVSSLKEDLDVLSVNLNTSSWEQGGIGNTTLSIIKTANYIPYSYISHIKCDNGYSFCIGRFTESGNYKGYAYLDDTYLFTSVSMQDICNAYPDDTRFKIECRKTDGTDFSTDESNVIYFYGKEARTVIAENFNNFKSNHRYVILGGNYSETLTLSGLKNVNIEIVGILNFTKANNSGIYITSCENINISGGRLIGGNITINNSPRCAVKNTLIENIGGDDKSVSGGMSIIGDCSNFLIDNVKINAVTAGVQTDDGFAHAYGIGIMSQEQTDGSYKYSQNGSIVNCKIHNINYDKEANSIYDGDGIYIIQRPYTLSDAVYNYDSNITIDKCEIYYCLKRAIKISGEKVTVNNCICYGNFYNSIIETQVPGAIITNSFLKNGSKYTAISICGNTIVSNVIIDDCYNAFEIREPLYSDNKIDFYSINNVRINYCRGLLSASSRNISNIGTGKLSNISIGRCVASSENDENKFILRLGATIYQNRLELLNISIDSTAVLLKNQVVLVNNVDYLTVKNCNLYPFMDARGVRAKVLTDVETTSLRAYELKITYHRNKMVAYADLTNQDLSTFGTILYNSLEGDIIINTNPTNGVYAKVCTVGGNNISYGTWKDITFSSK